MPASSSPTQPPSSSASEEDDGPLRGQFLTLEGSEGVGKTTNLGVIERYLRGQNIDVLVTREPGGTALGERIRALLLDVAADESEPPMHQMAELLLMFAARAQHVATVIEPALAAGRWVLSDRFTDASFAYQGAGREMGNATVATLETLVQGSLRPDVTLYLDLDPEIAFKRIAEREHDRIEREERTFFHRVRDCYLARAAAEPERFAIVDASLDIESVERSVVAALAAKLLPA